MKYLILCILLLFSVVAYTRPGNNDTMLQRGIDLYNTGDYETSVTVLQKRLEIAISETDKKTQSVVYNNIGNNYSQLGMVIKSLDAYQKAVSMAEEAGEKRMVASAIKNIGALYSDNKDFTKALLKYNEAEAIALSIKDTPTIADCANNRGVVYEQQLQYHKALEAYRYALSLYEYMHNDNRIGLLYNNMGIVHKQLQEYDKALEYYGLSLAMGEKLEDKFMVAANLLNMGNVYEKKGNYKKAIAYHNRAISIAREVGSPDLMIEAYASLAEAYSLSGDYKTGYSFYKQHVAVKDSFISIARSKQMAEMQTKYETVKKEHHILRLERTQLIMGGAIGLLFMLVAVAYLVYSRQRLKQLQTHEKALMDAEYKERMRIARDVHDDLGSGLSKISLIAGQAGNNTLAGTGIHKDILRITSVSKELVDNMRDLIWVLNPENTTLDNLSARLREYCADYLEGMGIAFIPDFPADIPQLRLSRELQRNVFATVKEAVHNAVKHAAATELSVIFRYDDAGLHIAVTDNGTGFDPATAKNSGYGLRNMKHRITTVGGTYVLTSAPGSGTTASMHISQSTIMQYAKNATFV